MSDEKFTAKEWNASGAFQFYGSVTPRSYIIEIDTVSKIDGEHLQKAINKTLERMPIFGSTFVRKKGLYYYADNDLPLLAVRSEKPRTIGGKETNYHMIDVTYYNKSVSFAMFHGLTDGYGLTRFAETVLYYYFCHKDGKEYSDEGIITLNTPTAPEETKDIHEKEMKADKKKLKEASRKELRFRLPELTDGTGPQMYIFPVKIRTDAFLSWCKAAAASPGAAVSAMTGQAVARENTVDEGVIMAMMPTSVRKYMRAEKTLKNCVSGIFLPMELKDCAELSTAELAAKLRKDMKEQLTESYAELMSSGINMLIHLGKKMPLFSLKRRIMAIKEKSPQDTFSVDYLGTLKTNDYSSQIESVRFLLPDSFKGSMFIMMYDCAGYFHVSFNQTFASDRYYQAFLKILEEQNITYEKLADKTYLNPDIVLPEEQR